MTLPLIRSGPEVLCGLESLARHDDGITLSMPVGTWCGGPDGRLGLGALGVIIDDALAMTLIDRRPPGTWSVSSEITIDAFSDLARPTEALTVDAIVVDADPIGGFATGAVRDDAGTVVAVASQRGRFVPADTEPTDTGFVLDPAQCRDDLGAMFGLRAATDGWELPVGPAVQNPMGRLHGGAAIAAADLAAAAALAETAGPSLVPTGIRMQYRRPVPGNAVLRVVVEVEHRGRTSAFVRVDGLVDGVVCVSAVLSAAPAPSGCS